MRGGSSASLRENGTAALLWLEPGSPGNSTAQTWQSADYYAPSSEQQAVDFPNAPARQGPGKASVTPRSNGATRLLWLEPGSLVTARHHLAVHELPRP